MYGEGLPEDRISTENGAIITCCKRWPLIIDPQVQGIKWLKQKQEKDGFVPCLLTQKNWIRAMRGGISDGMCVIIENLGEEIDATLDPVLSRAIYKKGRALFLKLGGEEVEYDPGFTLYLQTKLSNPHYKPEIAAQCTLITPLLRSGFGGSVAGPVGEERPDLEAETRLNAEAPNSRSNCWTWRTNSSSAWPMPRMIFMIFRSSRFGGHEEDVEGDPSCLS